MFNFQGLANSQLQTTDVKVMANNRIKLSQVALDTLKHTDETRLFIDKDRLSNKFWIAAIPVEKNEEGKVVSPGKKLNSDGAFSHQNLAYSLGGQYTELNIEKEGVQEVEGVKYFPLKEVVNGAAKRSDLETRAAAGEDVTSEMEDEDVSVEEEEEILN